MKYFWGSVISELRQKRRFERHFRSALNNGHRQQGSVGPVRANMRHSGPPGIGSSQFRQNACAS
jgi:hypothetical protein